MKELDEVIKCNAGITARIRCFGYGPTEIHALN